LGQLRVEPAVRFACVRACAARLRIAEPGRCHGQTSRHGRIGSEFRSIAREPAEEGVPAVGRGIERTVRAVCAVKRHVHVDCALFRRKDHIVIRIRSLAGVVSAQEDLHLTDAAVDQVFVDQRLSSGCHMAPDAHGAGEIVVGISAGAQQLGQAIVAVHPCRSDVVCKRGKRVILIAVQRDIVFGQKRVKAVLHAVDFFSQENISLVFCDPVGILVLRARGPVSDGVLGVIPVGIGNEALHRLDKGDPVLTRAQLEIRSRFVVQVVGRFFLAGHIVVDAKNNSGKLSSCQ